MTKYPVQNIGELITMRQVPVDGYLLLISNGGMTLKGKEGWTFEPQFRKEKLNKEQVEALSDDELEELGSKAVSEYRDFASQVPEIKGFDENLQ